MYFSLSANCWFFIFFVFFFKQKTAYEIVSRDWSSDVCSSDLIKKVHYARVWTVDEKHCYDLLQRFII